MISQASLLYGANDVRVESIELPPVGPSEVLLEVKSSSMCLSTTKAVMLGAAHKRVPDDVADNPAMTGHEFAGTIVEVGENLRSQYTAGQSIVVQPAMGLDSGYSPGYSYPYYGGDATYCIVPKVAVDKGCLLPYNSTYFGNASLAEPMMCIIGAFHANYHTENFKYEHASGVRPNGRIALLGAGGPMGIGAIDYALHGPYHPTALTILDNDADRLTRLKTLFDFESERARGTRVTIVNSAQEDPHSALMDASEGHGYDDVFVMAAVSDLVELGDQVLATDGCLNFFAGPTDPNFTARVNFYKVHYERTHYVGTSGGSAEDMLEGIRLSAEGKINPSRMVTHITGLNDVPELIMGLPRWHGGKILAYPHANVGVFAIRDLPRLASQDERFLRLAAITERNGFIWNAEAEEEFFAVFAK